MTTKIPCVRTKRLVCLVSALMAAAIVSGCGADAKTLDPNQIEQQYGVSGAYSGSVATPNGPMRGTIVPITLADGRSAQLIIPQRQASDVSSVYLVDNDGLHPVQLKEHASRQDVVRAPVVQRRTEAARGATRSWEKEALIIGGSAGAGTAIGALAGGKKGAGVGAAAGGVGGLIYDLLTRQKK
jgi:hypothetical protein